jgi:pimeloyl-ACP methyl ester carboxylesterase
LARVHAPTLLLWGSADRITPPALARRFAADLPDARVAEVEGAGHALALEAPDASAAAALSFLQTDPVP